MAELKAGGLALVIKSTKPGHVGRTVTLVRLIEPGLINLNGSWRNFKASEPAWLCKRPASNVAYYPWQLMPIDGDDFQREGERHKELIDG